MAFPVHKRPFVAAIALAAFARITPSSIGHRSLRCLLRFGLAVKTPWQWLRGVFQGDTEDRDVSPRRSVRGRGGIQARDR
jgi:hypothetical protein